MKGWTLCQKETLPLSTIYNFRELMRAETNYPMARKFIKKTLQIYICLYLFFFPLKGSIAKYEKKKLKLLIGTHYHSIRLIGR